LSKANWARKREMLALCFMSTNGTWYQKNKEKYFYLAKHYKTSACGACTERMLCTKNTKGRLIERSEYAPYIEQNKVNIEANAAVYRKRQSIVEHPYGTIKRQWGFDYIITKKGMKRASADVGLMFTAYNLRRLLNIIDKNVLTKFLKELALLFKRGKGPFKNHHRQIETLHF
jgi:Transposase DDE domain